MLDPRIYRTGFAAVMLAVVVVAFSLVDQQGPLGTTLAPDAFSGAAAYATMQRLAHDAPDRRPGSAGDERVALSVASGLRRDGYQVSGQAFSAPTVDGKQALQAVVGVRAGLAPGSVVVVSHRDSLHPPGTAELSGTATMLELARVLAGETQNRTIVLISMSGSAGLADSTELTRVVPGPIDAVITLGDLAGGEARSPIVVPWSTGQPVAPPLLRNTVAAALGSQAGLPPGGAGLFGQLEHLVLPLTVGEQGPFDAHGLPAVTLSLAGDHPVPAGEATSSQRIGALGRTLTTAVDALAGGPAVPSPRPYLLYSGKVVPAWAIRLLVLALMGPVLLIGIDGLARARRRRCRPGAGVAWTLATAAPFLLGVLMVIGARGLGVLAVAPPGPLAPGEVSPRGGAIWLLAGLAVVVPAAMFLVQRLMHRSYARHRAEGSPDGPSPGQGIGVLCVLSAATFALWLLNPFAALLVIPALHLWLWVLDAELRPRPALTMLLLLAGVAPVALVIVDYANTMGYGAGEAIWNGVLLMAGGGLAPAVLVLWSVLLGCVASTVAIVVAALRQPRPEDAPVTVRGPVTYAGPGSLGGTKSALRR